MLPAPARLRRREDFTLVVRRGRRSGRGTLVAHYLAPLSPGLPARAGFVVGRAVGNSVVRHRAVRRLRHLVCDRLDRLPAGSMLVVRALPPAATADSAALGRDLDAALTRLLPAEPPGPVPTVSFDPVSSGPALAQSVSPGPQPAVPVESPGPVPSAGSGAPVGTSGTVVGR